MTTYLIALSLMVTSVLFFTSKTEQGRVVTIHRPIMITQERKTPAYYVYQQAKNLLPQKSEPINVPSTYLSNQSLSPPEIRIQTAEMKFSKKEIIANQLVNTARATASLPVIQPIQQPKSLTYQQVFGANSLSEATLLQASEATSLAPSKKWATIKGKFELIEGVGIVNHHIEIKRVEEGVIREVGYIDLKAGTYSIDIESPQGYLIAQIKDQNGGLIGEDRARLVNLHSRGSFVEGPFIRVGRPETIAANPKPSSTAGLRSGVTVSLFDNQNALDKPSDNFANISKFSSTISRVFDASRIYRDLVTIRHTGDNTETEMFTTKWISGVSEYISDVQKIEFKTKNVQVIIGRVLVDGKSAANVQVQLESEPGLFPVYFDQFMIPAMNQTGTSENGYFMFIGIEPNNYHVVARRQNTIVGSQLFIVEAESLAFQNISTFSTPRNKVLRTFDAFSTTVVATDVITAESDEAIENTTGTTAFRSYSDFSVAEFLARPADKLYLPIRYVQSSKQEYVHIPMIQESWLNAIKKYKNIEEKLSSGTIIGFTKDLVYDAYLVSEDYNKNDIVFFNSIGQITNEPTGGGGFILFNVPYGARELIIQEKDSERIYSQVFNIVNQQVSVAHFLAD